MNKDFIKATKLNFSAYGYTILISFIIGIPMRLMGLSYNKTAVILSVLLICFNIWLFFILPYFRRKYLETMDFAVRFQIATSNRFRIGVLSDYNGGESATGRYPSSISEIEDFYIPANFVEMKQRNINSVGKITMIRGEVTQALTNR
jgi:hypothetical protein